MKTAQFLYDLRAATGFISGQDLHGLFRKMYCGESSPSGENPLDLVVAQTLCPELAKVLQGPVCEAEVKIRSYTYQDCPKSWYDATKGLGDVSLSTIPNLEGLLSEIVQNTIGQPRRASRLTRAVVQAIPSEQN